MKFSEISLSGAFIIELESFVDDRGSFTRTFCANEFKKYNLETNFVQCSASSNKKKHTLRGMHYQGEPYEEVKLVRCTQGRVLDIIVDIRPKSPTYLNHFSIELTATNHKCLYVPKGFAHGFLTLEDDSEIFYHMSEFYRSENYCGMRWNDPKLNISWPTETPIISEKDALLPLL